MSASTPRLAVLGLTFLAVAAHAQQDLEPAVQTSPAATSGAAQPAASPRAARPAAANGPTAAPAAAPPASAATAPAAAAAPAGAAAKGAKASDRIQLDTTQISGNRELPRVMYVVPWRRPDPGEFSGRPPNSLLDEALTPVDRDVFRRQNRYYSALSGEPVAPGTGTPAAGTPAAGSAKSQPGIGASGAVAPTPQDEK